MKTLGQRNLSPSPGCSASATGKCAAPSGQALLIPHAVCLCKTTCSALGTMPVGWPASVWTQHVFASMSCSCTTAEQCLQAAIVCSADCCCVLLLQAQVFGQIPRLILGMDYSGSQASCEQPALSRQSRALSRLQASADMPQSENPTLAGPHGSLLRRCMAVGHWLGPCWC